MKRILESLAWKANLVHQYNEAIATAHVQPFSIVAADALTHPEDFPLPYIDQFDEECSAWLFAHAIKCPDCQQLIINGNICTVAQNELLKLYAKYNRDVPEDYIAIHVKIPEGNWEVWLWKHIPQCAECQQLLPQGSMCDVAFSKFIELSNAN